MRRIKIGLSLFILILIGLYLYPGRERESKSPINSMHTIDYPSFKTQDKLINEDTELPIFRDLFRPLIRPQGWTQKEEGIEEESISFPPIFIRSSFRLVGIVMGSPPIAVLEESSTRLSHIVREGDLINDEEIVAIREDSVIVKKYGKELSLMLR